MIKAVLFDLDGTLLPMDNDEFTKGYFQMLAAKLEPHGYDAKQLINGIWAGVAAMVANDGSITNENAFWAEMGRIFGDGCVEDAPVFEDFYNNEFAGARVFCGFAPEAKLIVEQARSAGMTPVLATNPIFPLCATRHRIAWAGLAPEDFALVTTFENSCRCKPNPEYYRDISARLGLSPEECAMVGNDADEDLAALETGMKAFLLTDCLINRSARDFSSVPHGGFAELKSFIDSLNS